MTFMQICNENYSTIKTIMLLKILENSDLLDVQRSAITHCNPQEILARPLEAQFVCRSNGYGVTQCQSWVCYKFHYVQKKHNSNKYENFLQVFWYGLVLIIFSYQVYVLVLVIWLSQKIHFFTHFFLKLMYY